MSDEKLFYTIGEVSEILGLKAYVLRYWETEFKKLNPQKSFTGQRTYRARDVQLVLTIKKLLYDDKYTIAGAITKLDELDEKGELVAFPSGTTAPKPQEAPTKIKIVEPEPAPVEESTPLVETPVKAEEPSPAPAPKVDREKVNEFKALIEDTKTVLKKYNLS